jgi:hypothetical protein
MGSESEYGEHRRCRNDERYMIHHHDCTFALKKSLGCKQAQKYGSRRDCGHSHVDQAV